MVPKSSVDDAWLATCTWAEYRSGGTTVEGFYFLMDGKERDRGKSLRVWYNLPKYLPSDTPSPRPTSQNSPQPDIRAISWQPSTQSMIVWTMCDMQTIIDAHSRQQKVNHQSLQGLLPQHRQSTNGLRCWF